MGYDFSCVGDHHLVEQAAQAWEASWDLDHKDPVRDQAFAKYQDARAKEQNYFRLNIFGMGDFRNVMFDMGMLNTDPAPAWPDTPEGVDWDKYHEDESSYPEYRAAHDAVIGFIGPSPGISAHKFGSNDGWHVQPIEIKEALAAYQNYCDGGGPLPFGDPDRDAYFDEWIEFLRHTQEHGGFKVW
jgi:hypothetical protein